MTFEKMVEQTEDLDKALDMLRAYHDLIQSSVTDRLTGEHRCATGNLHYEIDRIIGQVAIVKWGRIG